jgi:hypothetical protein
MKQNAKAMEARAVWCERAITNMLGLTPEKYLELMYETGCEFVEDLFRNDGYTGKRLKRAVSKYITSDLYWYYWMIEWVDTCEAFLDWDYSKKSLTDLLDMQMQAKRPWDLLHKKIIEEKGHTVKVDTLNS